MREFKLFLNTGQLQDHVTLRISVFLLLFFWGFVIALALFALEMPTTGKNPSVPISPVTKELLQRELQPKLVTYPELFDSDTIVFNFVNFETSEKKYVSLNFFGTLMLSGKPLEVSEKHSQKPPFLFEKMKPLLLESDINFAMLKYPLYPEDLVLPVPEGCENRTEDFSRMEICCKHTCYYRSSPKMFTQMMFIDKINVLGIENKYMYEYGIDAALATQKYFRDNSLAFTGLGFASQIKVKDCLISILNYDVSSRNKTYLEKKYIQMTNEVKNAYTDFIVVTFYDEESDDPRHSDWIRFFSHKAIDYGARIVVGNYADNGKRLEIYQDGYIFYNLGALTSDDLENDKNFYLVHLELMNCKTMKRLNMMNATINENYQPDYKVAEAQK